MQQQAYRTLASCCNLQQCTTIITLILNLTVGMHVPGFQSILLSALPLSQGVGLVALNLELDIPLDTIFADGGISNAVDAFANAVVELDVRKSHCASRMDFAYLLSQVCRGGKS